MSLLWPESETHLAHSALRNTLARIKEALRGVTEPLIMDGDRVRINLSIASTLDLKLIAQATTDTQPTQIAPASLAVLQSAAEVARGPFMDGFSLPDAPAFDEWLTNQRAIWGHRQNLVYDRLSLHQLENHLIQPAIETVIRWIILDRLSETAYQRLMRLHFLNGDRAAALQAYKTCRDLLAQELGVRPAPATKELLAIIQSMPASVPLFESDTEARKPLHIPFVGRSNEYQGLVQSFRSAQKGRPQVVVLSGESGIGKTRPSDEFLKWARTEGADVLRGRAFETSGQLPYQPIIDALRERLERENAPQDLLDDAWLAELTRVLPELRERYPDLPSASGDDSTARSRLFEAVARLAEALSARQPLVWLMDELQWADAETLELLHYLSRDWQKGHAPILLLILMRAEALAHGSALRNWMSGLTRDIPTTRFTLSAMKAEDVQQLIFALAGDNAPGSYDLAAWFTAETAGQPFFLAETLIVLNEYRALIWRGEPSARKLDPQATLANLKSLGPQSLAPAIRNVVVSRLEWLSQYASSMLSAAAVIGRNCSLERLGQISGLAEQDSLNALDELLSARMMVEVRNETRPYTVSHDRIREVVYAQLSEARRQIFHRRALTGLTAAKAPPAELAYHALSAKEWQFAFQHSLDAGDEAMGLSAVTGAVLHYETARSLLNEEKADADDATRQRLFASLGRANELIGNYAQAETDYRTALSLAEAIPDPAAVARAQHGLGMLLRLQRQVANALDLLAKARDGYELLRDERALAGVLIEMGLVLFRNGEYADAQKQLGHGLVLARTAGDSRAVALALNNLGLVSVDQGEYAKAQTFHEESLALRRELGDKQGIASSLNNLGHLAFEQGSYATARTFHEESLALRREMGNKLGIAYSLGNLANIARQEGDFSEAHLLFAESLTLRTELNDKLGIALLLSAMGEMAVAEDDLTRAACLAAAAETLLTSFNGALQPDERAEQDKTIVAAREALGEPAFQSAWEAGQRLTMKEAVELALKEN